MMRSALLVSTLVCSVVAHAAPPARWSASTAGQFARGALDGVAIDEDGGLQLAPELATLWGPEAGIVWDVSAEGPEAAFVALSGPGRVLRVQAGRDAEVWYEPEEEALITAVVDDGRGGVWAASSPSGEVVLLNTAGQPVEAVVTGSTFVWALARDAEGGLWIGSGLPGRLIHRASDGTTRALLETGDDPVRCLAPLPWGGVVVGTGGRGRVIRVDPQGSAYVLYDAEEPEVVAVAALEDGSVFALTAGGARQVQSATGSSDARSFGASVTVTATAPRDRDDGDDEKDPGEDGEDEEEDKQRSAQSTQRPSRQRFRVPAGGALYRIDPATGAPRKIWATSREMPFDLAVRRDGRLLVATGDAGRIHVLDARGRSALLLRVASNQASALALGADDQLLIGGTGDARVELLGPRNRETGSYLSEPIDAGHVAEWGRTRWAGETPRGSRVRLWARGGNSDEPDETWSSWIPLAGKTEAATRVPASRWLQLRVDLERGRGGSPRLSELELVFQRRNRPPQLSRVYVDRPGVVWMLGPAPTSSRLGPVVATDPVARESARTLAGRTRPQAIRKTYEPGVRTFSWKAEDLDGDRLTYGLDLRREGSEEGWLPLRRNLEQPFYSWDARSMPDGEYRVRVTVVDAVDNPAGAVMQDVQVSEVFPLDNTRPTVAELEARPIEDGLELRFEALDEGGKIAACEIAVDGGDWQVVEPTDGVADSARESYRVVLDDRDRAPSALPETRRSLMVRVTDAMGNLGGRLWPIDYPSSSAELSNPDQSGGSGGEPGRANR